MKKWVCRICGYIHEGETPPERCPVCRAPSAQFYLQDNATKNSQFLNNTSMIPSYIRKNRLLSLLAEEFPLRRFHPIMVHFPNGLIPVSFVFLLITSFFDFRCVELTAFYLLCAAIAASPFAFVTGLYTWKVKYKGAATAKFKFKVYGSIAFMILALTAVGLRLLNPGVVESAPAVYLIINLILLGLVTMLGHIGGRIVFAGES